MGFLRDRLFKTRQNIFGRLKDILKGKAISPKTEDEVLEVLITADVSLKTAREVLQGAKNARSSQQSFLDAIRGELLKIFEPSVEGPVLQTPQVIMIVGVNGSGKTTTIGKLAKTFKSRGKEVILGACDTFRAAAVEQLSIWGEKTGCRVISQKQNADPASVGYDALAAAISGDSDYLILDTAGRLHTKFNLMEELKKIKRVLSKHGDQYPQNTWMVLDGTFGQNTLSQVKEFNDSMSMNGLIMTKLDGTAKGGALLSCVNEFGIPVKYIGVGEGEDDLVPFNAHDFVNAIFSE